MNGYFVYDCSVVNFLYFSRKYLLTSFFSTTLLLGTDSKYLN